MCVVFLNSSRKCTGTSQREDLLIFLITAHSGPPFFVCLHLSGARSAQSGWCSSGNIVPSSVLDSFSDLVLAFKLHIEVISWQKTINLSSPSRWFIWHIQSFPVMRSVSPHQQRKLYKQTRHIVRLLVCIWGSLYPISYIPQTVLGQALAWIVSLHCVSMMTHFSAERCSLVLPTVVTLELGQGGSTYWCMKLNTTHTHTYMHTAIQTYEVMEMP